MSAVVGSQDNLNTFAKEVMEGTETTEKKLKALGKAEADRIRAEREAQALLDAAAKAERQKAAARKFAMRVDESIQAGHKMLEKREVVAKSHVKK
jgi:regulator of protease activity HflC (stomatin/prohibitin superfamily)